MKLVPGSCVSGQVRNARGWKSGDAQRRGRWAALEIGRVVLDVTWRCSSYLCKPRPCSLHCICRQMRLAHDRFHMHSDLGLACIMQSVSETHWVALWRLSFKRSPCFQGGVYRTKPPPIALLEMASPEAEIFYGETTALYPLFS